MTDIHYQMASDGGPDDLPRTFRREREAREREAREREAREREAAGYGAASAASAAAAHATSLDPMIGADAGYAAAPAAYGNQPLPASVRRIDMPFLALMKFFLKAALAAVPAMILLGVILWGIGHLLQTFFPSLVKMQILVWFPN